MKLKNIYLNLRKSGCVTALSVLTPIYLQAEVNSAPAEPEPVKIQTHLEEAPVLPVNKIASISNPRRWFDFPCAFNMNKGFHSDDALELKLNVVFKEAVLVCAEPVILIEKGAPGISVGGSVYLPVPASFTDFSPGSEVAVSVKSSTAFSEEHFGGGIAAVTLFTQNTLISVGKTEIDFSSKNPRGQRLFYNCLNTHHFYTWFKTNWNPQYCLPEVIKFFISANQELHALEQTLLRNQYWGYLVGAFSPAKALGYRRFTSIVIELGGGLCFSRWEVGSKQPSTMDRWTWTVCLTRSALDRHAGRGVAKSVLHPWRKQIVTPPSYYQQVNLEEILSKSEE